MRRVPKKMMNVKRAMGWTLYIGITHMQLELGFVSALSACHKTRS